MGVEVRGVRLEGLWLTVISGSGFHSHRRELCRYVFGPLALATQSRHGHFLARLLLEELVQPARGAGMKHL